MENLNCVYKITDDRHTDRPGQPNSAFFLKFIENHGGVHKCKVTSDGHQSVRNSTFFSSKCTKKVRNELGAKRQLTYFPS